MVERPNPSPAQEGADRCFDDALSEYPTRTVALASVVDPLVVSHAVERIATYRVAMRAGDRFPPISVVPFAGRYVVVDGHKRFHAYRDLGPTEIVVEVWTVRRWLRDQWAQLQRKTRQQISVVGRSVYDPSARREAARLARDTVSHWHRLARSLRLMLHRRARGPRHVLTSTSPTRDRPAA